MNKIYKVVWSKAKHCYVVASELAKRQTKGCGARSLRMATVSLGVASALLCAGAVLPVFDLPAGHAEGASDNSITIVADDVIDDSRVFGGLAQSSLPSFAVYGGWSNDGTDPANSNKVFINSGTMMYAYGGCTMSGEAAGNEVTVNSGTVNNDVCGGRVNSNNAGKVGAGNTVNINGGSIFGKVCGGIAVSGDAIANTVNIRGGTVSGNVYGGWINNSGTAGGDTPDKGNKVIMTGGNVKRVTGGYSDDNSSNNAVTVSGGSAETVRGGATYNTIGTVNKNTVDILGGTVDNVYGGASTYGKAEENSVTISDGTVGNAYGGSTSTNNVAKNTVTLNGGKTGDGYDAVYGGSSATGNAENNHVNINGGTAYGNVYGGQSKSSDSPSGNVIGNAVTITKGTVTGANNQWIYGGYTWGKDGGDNASGKAEDNTVTISGGTLSHDTSAAEVYGGGSNGGDAIHNIVNIENTFTGTLDSVMGGEAGKNATKNEVTIAGGTVKNDVTGGQSWDGTAGGDTADDGNKVTITGGTVSGSVYGGMGSAVKNNSVTISDATVDYVYGGMGSDVKNNSVTITDATVNVAFGGSGKAAGNTVTVNSGTVNKVFGGRVRGSANAGEVGAGNTVNLNGGSVSDYVFGGYSTQGNAVANTVNIDGGYAAYVYGGGTYDTGTAGGDTPEEGNKVTMTGGSAGNVFGGYGGYKGDYSSTGDAKHNVVTISGGTVSGNVYGGYVYQKGSAINNTVTMSGGTAGRITGGINAYGTESAGGDAKTNTVTITGGAIGGATGGYSQAKEASGNTVTLSGATSASQNYVSIIGGFGQKVTDNTVNLAAGAFTKGAETETYLYGYQGYVQGYDVSTITHYGNELHLGGTKDESITGVWQVKDSDGTVTNKVNTVANFDKIVLHDVAWISDGAALDAKDMVNIGTLDIKNLKFYTDAAGTAEKTSFTEGESMALLKNDLRDLSAVKLTYKDGTGASIIGATITTEGVVLGGGATDKTEETGVNGVKLTQSVTEKVKLAEDKKAINYSCDVGEVKGVTFNASTPITFADGGIARDLAGSTFAATNTVDAENLQFADTGEAVAVGNSMTLVANAAGIATKVANNTGKTVAIKNYEDAQKIKYNATASGMVTSAGGAVKYTVDAVTLNSVDLGGWNGTTSDLSLGNTSGWTGAGVTVSGSFTEPEVAANSAKDIVKSNVAGMFTEAGIAEAIKYKAGATFTGDEANGVTLAGTQSKGVKAADSGKKLIYEAGAKEVTGITLGAMTVGTPRDMNSAYDFAGVTTVDASGLTFDKPEDVKADVSLVTNATGLAAGKDVTGKDHAQSFEKTAENNVVLTASLKGTVATVANGVTYTYGSTELTKVDLAKWNGNASDVPTGWTGMGVTVSGSFTEPEVAANSTKDILTNGATGMFTDEKIDSAIQYKAGATFTGDEANGVILAGTQSKGVKAADGGKKLIYEAGAKEVTDITLGAMFVGTPRDMNTGYDFAGVTTINASGLTFDKPENVKADVSLVTNATGLTAGKDVTGKDHTQSFEKTAENNVVLTASLKGTVATIANGVTYTYGSTELTKVDLAQWNGSEAAVTDGWTAADGSVQVTTGSFAAPEVAAGASKTILTAGGAFFADANISGANKYDENNGKAFSETQNNVTVAGKQAKGVAAGDSGKSLVYKAGTKNADTVTLGSITWQKGATLFDGSDAGYNYANVAALGTDTFAVSYDAPETVAKEQSMTLLKANETLKDMAAQTKTSSYKYSPVAGVTMEATLTGKLAASGSKVTFTAAENKASKLTFGDVEWKDSGALLNHKTTLANVSFNGANVDTSKIKFTNAIYLDAEQQMTLVSDFGDSVGTITGDKYMVGTAFEGEGAASLQGSDLIFRTKTGAGVSEQTHKAVMGVEATMALLASGGEHVADVLDGLGDASNAGRDGVSTAASLGGGASRYETGSYVSARTWNAAAGIGAKKETKKGVLQYGIFGEYGKGSYTLHSDAGRSTGDAHYAGGGLLAKWTNKHDVYAEVSFRLGRMSDSANDLLRDAAGNAYGYDIHANYFGAHAGVGKVFNYNGGKSLDVYGKYFYTRRDGAEFDAVQHYNLDSVSSSVLRIGARYGSKDKKWNWYGGLAYEYEFDGESKGTVNGTEIRAASVKGSSVRAELGIRMDATKTNPLQTDISIYGYGGKHRGIGGNVSVAYTF